MNRWGRIHVCGWLGEDECLWMSGEVLVCVDAWGIISVCGWVGKDPCVCLCG